MTTEIDAEGLALAPCPFCGSNAIDPTGWASTDSAGPACEDCGASAGKSGDTVKQNVAAWNRRAVLPAEPVALPYVVQYRLKGHWRWQDMAAFDNERIAENYRDECAKGRIPWEYQVVTRTAIRSSLIAEAGEPAPKAEAHHP